MGTPIYSETAEEKPKLRPAIEKTYVSFASPTTKFVRAIPMNCGTFRSSLDKENPNSAETFAVSDDTAGLKVTHSDASCQWMPNETFDLYYRELTPEEITFITKSTPSL